MKKTLFILSALCCTASSWLPAAAHGSNSPWTKFMDLHDKCVVSRRSEDLVQAKLYADQALAEAEKTAPNRDVGVALLELIDMVQMDHDAEVSPLVKRLIANELGVSGNCGAACVPMLEVLAQRLEFRAQIQNAILVRRLLLQYQTQAFGPDHDHVIDAQDALAKVLTKGNQKQHHQGEKIWHQLASKASARDKMKYDLLMAHSMVWSKRDKDAEPILLAVLSKCDSPVVGAKQRQIRQAQRQKYAIIALAQLIELYVHRQDFAKLFDCLEAATTRLKRTADDEPLIMLFLKRLDNTWMHLQMLHEWSQMEKMLREIQPLVAPFEHAKAAHNYTASMFIIALTMQKKDKEASLFEDSCQRYDYLMVDQMSGELIDRHFYPEALRICQRGEKRFHASHLTMEAGANIARQAEIYARMHDYQQANKRLSQARAIFAADGSPAGEQAELHWLHNQVKVLTEINQPQEALLAWQQLDQACRKSGKTTQIEQSKLEYQELSKKLKPSSPLRQAVPSPR